LSLETKALVFPPAATNRAFQQRTELAASREQSMPRQHTRGLLKTEVHDHTPDISKVEKLYIAQSAFLPGRRGI